MSLERAPDADAIPDEERARAQWYALLGRLFHRAPDARLLADIGGQGAIANGEAGDDLGRAWCRLAEAAGGEAGRAANEEYEALFGGVGRAVVTPYTSAYVTGIAPDRHLVALRELLGEWGLARRNMVFEVEDHISGVFDVMRLLISKNQSLEEQEAFFMRFVHGPAHALCAAIEGAEASRFYREVAAVARAFLELERSAFDMIDGLTATHMR